MSHVKPALVALSIKQPWAALIVHGRKTIEVRRWPTPRRGRILIHASSVPDQRDEAWKHIDGTLSATAQLRGGIIGSVELTGCKRYADLPTFMLDQPHHFNEADWFAPPALYGFTFAEPETIPYFKFPGWFRFFRVECPDTMEIPGARLVPAPSSEPSAGPG